MFALMVDRTESWYNVSVVYENSRSIHGDEYFVDNTLLGVIAIHISLHLSNKFDAHRRSI